MFVFDDFGELVMLLCDVVCGVDLDVLIGCLCVWMNLYLVD